jgi:hypothetical protein
MLLLKFTLGFDIRKVHKHNAVLTLNGTYQLMVHAADVNLLVDNIINIKKKIIFDANKWTCT